MTILQVPSSKLSLFSLTVACDWRLSLLPQPMPIRENAKDRAGFLYYFSVYVMLSKIASLLLLSTVFLSKADAKVRQNSQR